MKPGLYYVVSEVQDSKVLEWTADFLRSRYPLSFVMLTPSLSSTPLIRALVQMDVRVNLIRYRGFRDWPSAVIRLYVLFRSARPAWVHIHLLSAQLTALPAAFMARVPSRFYTRHNSTFHQTYHKKGRIYDWMSNILATRIVSPSQATDYALLTGDRVPVHKVRRIPHGIRTSYFADVTRDRVDRVRSAWSVPVLSPVVGVISRLVEWKGLQYIVPAFVKFHSMFPSACLVIANAGGPYLGKLKDLLAELPDESYRLIPFETDSAALYRCFDLLVHTPVDPHIEAFGQVYIEAMASGLPCIITPSGVAAEMAEHGKNAWVVEFQSSSSIAEGLCKVWSDPELRKVLSEGARMTSARFSVELMGEELCRLYDE
jgi:glycosyltransferase involved in cell wall biosynthesis